MVVVKHGNVFTSGAQTLVNTVNTVGVMGAGIALEHRLRSPEMFKKYQALCKSEDLTVGKLWLYKGSSPWVLNFPTKKHWKYPSKESYLEAGLEKFLATYERCGITSIAFPLLGADKGGIDADRSLSIMQRYLVQADIPVEIYHYDPKASDDLYDKTKAWLLSQSPEQVSAASKIQPQYLRTLYECLESDEFKQLNQLGRVKGIGLKTLEKVFLLAQSECAEGGAQKALF